LRIGATRSRGLSFPTTSQRDEPLPGRDEEIKTPGTRTNYAEGATLLKDPRSGHRNGRPLRPGREKAARCCGKRTPLRPRARQAYQPATSTRYPNLSDLPEEASWHASTSRHCFNSTVERPDAWTAEDEAEHVRSNTIIGQYPLDDVEITYFEPAESEGGEG